MYRPRRLLVDKVKFFKERIVIMEKIKKYLKDHIICVLIFMAIIVLWIANISWVSKDKEVIGYVSFASAVVSIILAALAIVFSYLYNLRSQENIGTMRTLIGDASRIVAEKADVLAKSAVSMGEGMTAIQEMLKHDIVPNKPSAPFPDMTFKFDASALPPLSLLSLYCLVKAHETGKILYCLRIAKAIVALREDRLQDIDLVMNGSVILSTVYAFWSFFGTESMERQQNGFKVHNLPKGLREYIEVIISKRIEDLPDRNEHRQLLETGPTAIDAQFESL